MSVRVVLGEISAKDVTARAVVPSANVPRWPPFERVAESVAAPRRSFPSHRHEGVEVLTYVVEGWGQYGYGTGPPTSMPMGAMRLLTAPTAESHSINPEKGKTVRWFASVARLSDPKVAVARLQSAQPESSGLLPDGTVVRRLVGPGSSVVSAMGLECEVIEFQDAGDTFRKVGHDRAAVIYALSGHGSVDTESLEMGEAALVESAAGVAIHGQPGLRVVLASAPRAVTTPGGG